MPTTPRRNARNSVPAVTLIDTTGDYLCLADFADKRLFVRTKAASFDFDGSAVRQLIRFLVEQFPEEMADAASAFDLQANTRKGIES